MLITHALKTPNEADGNFIMLCGYSNWSHALVQQMT